MPYEDSPHFKTPCYTKPLWRYMHIDKFLAMLSSKTLYFPNVYSYNDRFEGRLSEKSKDEIRKISLFDEKNTLISHDTEFNRKRESLKNDCEKRLVDEKRTLNELVQEQEKIESGRIFEQLINNFLSHLMYCNSWFLSEKESHTMWAEYGDKISTSIAIQTTVGNLIESLKCTDNIYKSLVYNFDDSLESDKYTIHIGKVNYKDYLTDDIEGYEDFQSEYLNGPDNVLKLFYAPFLHKRDVYMDEHEVRAIISFEDVSKEFLGRVYTSKIPFYTDPMFQTDVSLLREYNNPINNADNGIPIKVNLHILLKRIVISPTVNNYFNIPFEDLIKRYGIDPKIISTSQISDIQETSQEDP